MRLKTIWSIRGMSLKERLRRTGNWLAMEIAAHLPKRVRYWTFIQVGSKAMLSDDVVPDVAFMALLERAEGGPR